MSTYQTQRLKQFESKMSVLKLAKVEAEGRLEVIANSVKKMEILIQQEKQRIAALRLGDKKTS